MTVAPSTERLFETGVKLLTVTCYLTNGDRKVYRNAIRIDCDGMVVAIHFYNQEREVETAFYEIGHDHTIDCMINRYEVKL